MKHLSLRYRKRRNAQQQQEFRDAQRQREDLPAIALRLTIEKPGITRRILELRRRSPIGKLTHMFAAETNCGPRGKCLLFRLAERTTRL